MEKLKITDDLEALLNTLPEEVVAAIRETNDTDNLLEVILDLGRVPTARFVDGEVDLSMAGVHVPIQRTRVRDRFTQRHEADHGQAGERE